MADQPLGGDPRHGVVSMMDAPISVIAKRVGEGAADLSRGGGSVLGFACGINASSARDPLSYKHLLV
jgi:hypothetical protein